MSDQTQSIIRGD